MFDGLGYVIAIGAVILITLCIQTNESDISFLTRMAEMLGVITTIKNGSLLFILSN
ncbi:Phage protein [Providencia stuartii]|nr:Phage protein [Providencia stuartii]CAK6614087.1 Phage protein [Providencia stuartii]